MFDFGLLTVPAFAASFVFFMALFTGEDIAIDKINVSHQLEWTGYSSNTVTRHLTDELRELGEQASSELTGIEVDGSSLEKSVSAFEEYFELGLLVNGTRNLFGMIPYYINGEVTERQGQAVFTARIYTKDKENPVHLVSVQGEARNMEPILHEGALGILEKINPYVVALYHRRQEIATKQFDFPKTREVAKKFLKTRPVEEHYLAYGLIGRMHMLKAEKAEGLTPEQRDAEYATAIDHLHGALRQKPDFLFPVINLALIYSAQGKHDLADLHFAQAIGINPDYKLTRKSWGDALIRQERYRDAVDQYVAAVDLDPKDAASRDRLAFLYMKLGHTEAARKQWTKALDLEPLNQTYTGNLDALRTSGL
ncbi:tetratricopeptide repeat protein [Azospirillum sp. SYSU D00513]|uniref:tetratricopeptide repeat protein n=1 Tax=Azospirillum sp. SYSU D00513 TaxID=2812561 RepID=UPI001A9565AA|nr:tetratricopeptide repeat protein [Azospirillum sp. SYSU D00513]